MAGWTCPDRETIHWNGTLIDNYGGTIPKKAIIMWSGTLTSIPAGWILCDGSNGTPDLRKRFVRGAQAGSDAGLVAGCDTHAHNLTGSTASESSHTHTFSGTTAANTSSVNMCSGSDPAALCEHTHTFSGTTAAGSAHSHGVGTLAITDGDNVPRYFEILFIMKT